MRLRPFIYIFSFISCALTAHAQLPAETTSSSMPQWQMTLEMIKSKAQTLMVQNSGLQDEYRQLKGQAGELQQEIDRQQAKNQQMEDLIMNHHGRSDQQMRVELLQESIKAKKLEAQIYQKKLESWASQKADMDHKIEQLKYTISGLELHRQALKAQPTPAPKPVADELGPWRSQLEEANQQEVILSNELETLKTGDKSRHVDVQTIEEQNRQLEDRLNVLRFQKMRHLSKPKPSPLARTNARRYNELKKRKDQLELSISAYESRLDDLRESSLMDLSWPLKKKKLVHQMVQIDARNNQVRGNIKDLKEDIDVLKEQISNLQRRLEAAKEGKTSSDTSHWVDLNLPS